MNLIHWGILFCGVMLAFNGCRSNTIDVQEVVALEEIMAYSNIPVCSYIYRVSNGEKRISAVRYNYARNKSESKRNVIGKVNFHFDREGRVIKIERGDGIYEVEYESAEDFPYRKI